MKNKILTAATIATLSIATPFIIKWEDTKNWAYQDIVDVWTICSGETRNVYRGMYRTDKECEEMTRKAVLEFAQGIDDMVKVPMTPELHAALTSWAYNVGLEAARRSTLIRRLNTGDYRGACEQLKRWNKAGGQTVRGLVNRRADEYQMCIKGIK
jgi:lysozyme